MGSLNARTCYKFLFNKKFNDSTLAKRHIVVGHFVWCDTGRVMQTTDVTRHSRITQQLVPSTTVLSFVCCFQFACKKSCTWLSVRPSYLLRVYSVMDLHEVIAVYTVLRYSWWWRVDMSETCILLNKFEKLCISLASTIRIYHDALSSEYQKPLPVAYNNWLFLRTLNISRILPARWSRIVRNLARLPGCVSDFQHQQHKAKTQKGRSLYKNCQLITVTGLHKINS